MGSYSALIVNDNKELTEKYRQVLGKKGYDIDKIECFPDFNSALNEIINKEPNLLMIDFKVNFDTESARMEVEKTFDSLKENGYRGKVIAIIGNDSYPGIKDKYESENGVDVTVLKKPFDFLSPEFRDAVKIGEENE